jgi:hypothetical protein
MTHEKKQDGDILVLEFFVELLKLNDNKANWYSYETIANLKIGVMSSIYRERTHTSKIAQKKNLSK